MKRIYHVPTCEPFALYDEGFVATSGSSNQNTPDRSDEEGPNKTEIFNDIKQGIWE